VPAVDGPRPRKDAVVELGGGEITVSIQLKDTNCEAVLDYVAKLAGYTWAVDRFGIILFSPAKK
jgi:hypothetical protein